MLKPRLYGIVRLVFTVILLSACGSAGDGAARASPEPGAQPPSIDFAPAPDPDPLPATAPGRAPPRDAPQPTSPPLTGGGSGGALDGTGALETLNQEELRVFSEDCEDATRQYAQGDVAYPRRVRAEMGEAINFEAAVSIRQEAPSSPTDLISATDPAEEPVKVQCLVAARLVSVSRGIEIEKPDEAGDGGWIYQQFTPDGNLEWAWSVTPTTPRNGTVRLEMRPAVKGLEVTVVSRGKTARFSSNVVVHASWLQRGAYWTQDDGQNATVIASFVGLALLGLLGFVPKVREAAVTAVFRRGDRTSPSTVQATSMKGAVAASAVPSSRKRKRAGRT